MAIIKSYTSLEQSKMLAEFLPLESADIHWQYIEEDNGQLQWFCFPKDFSINQYDKVSAWSLAALLSVLPIVYINNKKEACGPIHIDITDSKTPFVLWYVNPLHKGSIVELKTKEYDNLVDACVDMIEKLHEQNLI